MSIVKRGITIAIGAPIAVCLTLHPITITALVWITTFLAMVEWTALKRHLKVVLLATLAKESGARHTTPPPDVGAPQDKQAVLGDVLEEHPCPVARTNAFIIGKCFLSTLPVPCCALAHPEYFHFASTCYFFFWIVFTLSFQNKLEHTAYNAKRKVETTPVSPAEVVAIDLRRRQTEQFALRELDMIASQPVTDNFLSFALEYFGFVWILGLAHALLLYHHIPGYGPVTAVIVLVSNWANDAFALIVGKSLKGRTVPLYPRISPAKTREGALGGVIANGICAACMVAWWPAAAKLNWGPGSAPLTFFIVGLFFGVLGVIGDLLQSLFKRTARVKDTGALLPGHGGVLDRIDGLLVTLPVAYWLVWAFLHVPEDFSALGHLSQSH